MSNAHKCYYPEISIENCNETITGCECNRKSGVCRVQFVVKATAREQARLAYCRTIGETPDGEYCISKEYRTYCGKCEKFMENYDSLHSIQK